MRLPSRLPPATTPLISDGLTGCPCRMTTYRENDIAGVDSFVLCTGAPSSVSGVCVRAGVCLVAGSFPGGVVKSHARPIHCVAIAEGRRANVIKPDGAAPICNRMSTEVLHSVFGQEFFPSGAVDNAALVPRVLRASTQMADMGLWHPPVGPGLDTEHQHKSCPGCSRCRPVSS